MVDAAYHFIVFIKVVPKRDKAVFVLRIDISERATTLAS
jgi:hypothetical protein